MAGSSNWLLTRVKATEIVGSRSDGSGRTQARGRRRTGASGGGLAGVPRVRARGLDFVRGLHRDVEREVAD
jgi:hypothetical protein